MGHTPEAGFISLEGDPQSKIKVVRYLSTGETSLGRPVGQPEEYKFFPSYVDALDWVAEGTHYNHHFEIRQPYRIYAYLTGVPRVSDEQLIVRLFHNWGISPRSVAGHHAVSTDYDTFTTIIIENVGDEQLFDRGLAWLNVTNPDQPILSFNLLGGVRNLPGDLVQGFNKMIDRVNEVLVDLGRGTRK
ncbi:hypothetical protein HY408_00900 [Candidatus Gottesmanbacteria bacterium]|nr:hypothetical protein [Candidatus Gottesmanbacteria bacterium]